MSEELFYGAQVGRFLDYVANREVVRKRKEAGVPPPWTNDPILQEYRFCNVYREDDKVTRWFRENIRGPLRDNPDVLYATIFFRWFNKIETAYRLRAMTEALNLEPLTAFRRFEPHIVRTALEGVSPIVTGAYIIKTPNGMNKLEGILWCLGQISPYCANYGRHLLNQRHELEDVHRWLMQFPFMGPFMAYEVVTDLRHTELLHTAPDILTWANAGPGAIRGLNRIHGRPLEAKPKPEQLCKEMHELLLIAQKSGWADWEMREVEHGLCEFDKYERARLGEGTPKQRYKAT